MPNIWHTKHQKTPFMRCSKSHNFCHMWTVPFHFETVRTRMLKKKKIYSFLSHPFWLSLFSLFLFLFSFFTTPSLSLSFPLFFFFLQKLHFYFFYFIRASTAGVVNVPNAKYLAHLPHQTPKIPFIRCVKSHKIYNMWTVSLQICNGIDKNGKKRRIVFYSFSLILFLTFSLLSLSVSFLLLRHSISVTLFSSFLLLSPEASLPLDFSSLALFHESRRNCSQKIIF